MSEVKVYYTYVLVNESFAKRESRVINHVTEYLNPKTGEWERSLYEHAWILKTHHDQALAEKDKETVELIKLLNSVVKHTEDVQLEKNLEIYSLHEKIIKTIQPIAERLGMVK